MMMRKLIRLCMGALIALPCLAVGQTFPERAITMVVPFPPGGSVDAVARRVAQGLSETLGQSVVVENRSGAGGTIGATAVANAPAGGYTLMFATSSALVVSPALYKNISYTALGSFDPIIEVTRGPFILTVAKNLPVNNVGELLAYAKQNPGKLNYASAGPGSAHHLAMEGFKQVSGMEVFHIPYKGGAPAWPALLAGEVQMLFDSMPGPLMHVGHVKPIAVTGPTRLDALPEVPTFAEQGVAGVDNVFLFGVVGPHGIPKDRIEKLHAALLTTLERPEVVSALKAQGLDASPGTPEQFGALLAKEAPRFKALVEHIGLTID